MKITKIEAGHGKGSTAARWCRRIEAKDLSRVARRQNDKREVRETPADMLAEDRADMEDVWDAILDDIDEVVCGGT
jgi:hypothetical protein